MLFSLNRLIKTGLFLILTLPPFDTPIAMASMPEAEYMSQLKLANQSVQQKKEATLNSQALSSTLLKRLFGRYYRKGDNWNVVAWQFENGMMRMTDAPHQTETKLGQGGIFHYEVMNVKNGTHPEVTIQVSQLNRLGFNSVDPKVDKLTLTMNDQYLQSEKIYYLSGEKQGKPASSNGVHTDISRLELFPLDVPDISSALEQKLLESPKNFPQVEAFIKKYNWTIEVGKTLKFEQDDFFGRPVEIIWEPGKPWPSYIKTSGGIALLLSKEIL